VFEVLVGSELAFTLLLSNCEQGLNCNFRNYARGWKVKLMYKNFVNRIAVIFVIELFLI
jgi:hypothetical protein